MLQELAHTAVQLNVPFSSSLLDLFFRHIDLNAKDILPLFVESHLKARVTRYGQDPETVHEAWEECRTIATANEAHFIEPSEIIVCFSRGGEIAHALHYHGKTISAPG
jgi:hypothetical protein